MDVFWTSYVRSIYVLCLRANTLIISLFSVLLTKIEQRGSDYSFQKKLRSGVLLFDNAKEQLLVHATETYSIF